MSFLSMKSAVGEKFVFIENNAGRIGIPNYIVSCPPRHSIGGPLDGICPYHTGYIID